MNKHHAPMAAAAFLDITPLVPVPLAGVASRVRPFDAIGSRLEVNALAVRKRGGHCVVIVTIDTLFVGRRVHELLSAHFEKRHGQRASDLMILASHTHFAPSIDESKPRLGPVDLAYQSLVVDRCCGLIDKVVTATGVPVHVERRQGTSTAAINRRRHWPFPRLSRRGIAGPEAVMAPNPAGPIDRRVVVWTLAGPDKRPLAMIWHFSCHPTGYPRKLDVSSEFPGVVRARLRARFGANLPVLFLQGFAGDIRPNVPETRSVVKRASRSFFRGPNFDEFNLEGWERWAEGLADDVERVVSSAETLVPEGGQAADAISSASYAIPLSLLAQGEAHDRLVRLHRLRIGSTIDIVAVAAEPLCRLGALVPFSDAAAVGYLGDTFGYWPSDADQPLGGYEVRHFVQPFSLAGPLRESLDLHFLRAMEHFARVD